MVTIKERLSTLDADQMTNLIKNDLRPVIKTISGGRAFTLHEQQARESQMTGSLTMRDILEHVTKLAVPKVDLWQAIKELDDWGDRELEIFTDLNDADTLLEKISMMWTKFATWVSQKCGNYDFDRHEILRSALRKPNHLIFLVTDEVRTRIREQVLNLSTSAHSDLFAWIKQEKFNPELLREVANFLPPLREAVNEFQNHLCNTILLSKDLSVIEKSEMLEDVKNIITFENVSQQPSGHFQQKLMASIIQNGKFHTTTLTQNQEISSQMYMKSMIEYGYDRNFAHILKNSLPEDDLKRRLLDIREIEDRTMDAINAQFTVNPKLTERFILQGYIEIAAKIKTQRLDPDSYAFLLKFTQEGLRRCGQGSKIALDMADSLSVNYTII